MAKKPDTAKTDNKQVNKQAGNRGSFKAGQSGNPKGRPCTTEDKELKELDKLEKQVDALEGARHERHVPDPSKVFRLAGLGEVAVARMVRKLAEKAKSEVVRLRACELACKVLKMVTDAPQQGPVGIQIVFTCNRESQAPAQSQPVTIDLTPRKD